MTKKQCLERVVNLMRAAHADLSCVEGDDKNEYICHALIDASWKNGLRFDVNDADAACRYVMDVLGSADDFADWVRKHNRRRKFSYEEMQQLRHQWLDQVANHLEKFL